MYPGQTAPDSTGPTPRPLKPHQFAPPPLSAEAASHIRAEAAGHTSQGPPKRGEKNFGGRVQNKCTQDRRLCTDPHPMPWPLKPTSLPPPLLSAEAASHIRAEPALTEVKGTLEGGVQKVAVTHRRPAAEPPGPLGGKLKPPCWLSASRRRSAEPRPRWPGPPKRGEKNFGGRVQNKCTQDRPLRTRTRYHCLSDWSPLGPAPTGSKRTLEGESSTKCTQDRRTPDPAPQPLKPHQLISLPLLYSPLKPPPISALKLR